MADVSIVGAGLAGCEAAWQLAKRGIAVDLFEMRPARRSPAHHTDCLGELVCSNSLRSDDPSNAVGLLKNELRAMDSLLLSCADACRVQAGSALAVDRERFCATVTERVQACAGIALHKGCEIDQIPDGACIIATGPLTSDALADTLHTRLGAEFLHFFDAAAPIVTADSIDRTHAYAASRYGKGSADYLNCPLNKEEYHAFVEALTHAEEAPVHGFEDSLVFEGCMPIEVNARRGEDTLRFGILKPVGLPDPRTGRDPYAVLQLRMDNSTGSLYNLVGCQTHLKWGEQKRIFGMIPALAHAEFVRYGVMHRNTFLDAPRLLDATYALRGEPRLRFAGQMTGVEGYVESIASGLVAGLATACELRGRTLPPLDRTTALGALACYISDPTVQKFQPMNVNYGLFDPLTTRVRGGKKARHEAMAARAVASLAAWKAQIDA